MKCYFLLYAMQHFSYKKCYVIPTLTCPALKNPQSPTVFLLLTQKMVSPSMMMRTTLLSGNKRIIMENKAFWKK
jgi:hypothetical protein